MRVLDSIQSERPDQQQMLNADLLEERSTVTDPPSRSHSPDGGETFFSGQKFSLKTSQPVC